MYNQFISLLITHTQLDSGIHLLNVEWNAISIHWFPLRMAPELVLFRSHCLGSTDAQRWFRPTEESACLGSLPIFQHQGGAEMYTYPYTIIEGTITCTWYSNLNNFLILLSCIHVHSTALFSFLFSVSFTYIFFLPSLQIVSQLPFSPISSAWPVLPGYGTGHIPTSIKQNCLHNYP